jgi:hypothetical protein
MKELPEAAELEDMEMSTLRPPVLWFLVPSLLGPWWFSCNTVLPLSLFISAEGNNPGFSMVTVEGILTTKV